VISLNRGLVIVARSVETDISPGVVFADISGHQYFFSRHIPQAVRQASRVISFGDEASIRAGDHIIWEPWNEWEWYPDEIVIEHHDNVAIIRGSYNSPEERERIEQDVIASQLHSFRFRLEEFTNTEGLLYYLRAGDTTYSNIGPGMQNMGFFLSQPVHFLVTDTRWEVSHSSNVGWQWPTDATIFLAFPLEVVAAQTALYTEVRAAHIQDFAIIGASIVLGLALALILLLGAGRRRGSTNREVHFALIDRPYLDIGLAVIFCWVLICVAALLQLAWHIGFYGDLHTWGIALWTVLLLIFTVATVTPALLWLLSFAKRLKAGRFWEHTLVFAVCSRLVYAILAIVNALWEGFPLAARLWVLPLRYARRIYKLEQGAREVVAGSWNTKIEAGDGELGSIANSINNISAGIHWAVEERMKSERLKTELITNVSHDIRTPLTSIITYTDLLQQGGLASENAPEYLCILIQKSARLKTLTDELFEAAKAASGSIEVQLTELDFVSLIEQVLGELDSAVKASGLEFRVNLPERLPLLADGRLLWRVMENLLSNVFKYALPGSRVYLDARQIDKAVCIELKNVSAVELNMDPSELTERFKRGDDSRTDGGTGLGLSIVQSFVTAQGGKFNIYIDGDLFKATIWFPSAGQDL